MTQNYFDEKRVEFSNLIDKSVLSVKNKFFDDRVEFFKSLKNESKDLILSLNENQISDWKKLDLSIEFHKKIKSLINNEKELFSSENYNEDYREFHSNVEQYINSIPEILEKPQSENNFKCSKDNSAFICFMLKFKNLYFSLRNKKNKDYSLWKRKIPYKNINQFFFKYSLFIIILEEISLANKKISEEYIEIYKTYLTTCEEIYHKVTNDDSESEISDDSSLFAKIDEAIEIVSQLKNEFSANLENHLTDIIDKYKSAIEKAGTIESLFSKFPLDELKKFEVNVTSLQNKNAEKLKGFNDALFNNWNFYEDILHLNYFANVEYGKSKEKIDEKLSNVLLPKFVSIVNLFEDIHKRVKLVNQKNELKNFLKNEQKKLSVQLKENIIVDIVKFLPFENSAPLIEIFKNKLKNEVDILPDERSIVNLNELKYGITKSDFQKIPSKEIIHKTILNKTNFRLSKLIKQSNEKIQEISSTVLDLSEIADYNFDTAISMLESTSSSKSEKVRSDEDGFNIAVEGINRIVDRSNELITELQNFNYKTFQSLRENINTFSASLFNLNKTDELTKQKIQLSKQKAQDEVKSRFDVTKNAAKNFVPVLTRKMKSGYDFILTKVFRLSEKVGLTSQSNEATEEILNYIIETEKQISNLPLVYQRLYKNIPVDDERFFIGRDKELERINKAYKNWEEGKFAPVAVISEKGAGASSITNITEKKLFADKEVIHINMDKNIYKPEEFFKLISKNLKIDEVKNISELIDKINSLSENKIVIIQNIENFYLRIVNGFEVMKMFFQVLSTTNNKIFWISTCNQYAWNYFLRVLKINDFFGYVVSFKKLKDNEITEIIMKRHNMSGYKLKFLPDKSDINNKQFLKLSEEEKDQFLRNKFFEDLNKISQSNVGLAQLFWLRSIVSLTDNQINIASLSSINFGFLKGLSKEKVFSLAALLIHDGLTIEEHAKVFNMSIDQSKLLLYAMFDDGEIRITNDVYRINFLLYVHAIKLLKDQNILH